MDENHVHTEDCDHGHEEFSLDELVQVTEDKVDALINLLLKKGLIKEDELQGALEELYEEGSEDDSEDDEE